MSPMCGLVARVTLDWGDDCFPGPQESHRDRPGGRRGKTSHAVDRRPGEAAVPFGGIYRLIDFALSNVVNSGYLKVVVLTQYKSHSLDRHVTTTWRMSTLLGNYVTPVPAQQRVGKRWYLGSADAIYQSLNLLNDEDPDIVVVVGAITCIGWTSLRWCSSTSRAEPVARWPPSGSESNWLTNSVSSTSTPRLRRTSGLPGEADRSGGAPRRTPRSTGLDGQLCLQCRRAARRRHP